MDNIIEEIKHPKCIPIKINIYDIKNYPLHYHNDLEYISLNSNSPAIDNHFYMYHKSLSA